jgi:hypothetical protein
VASVDLKDVVPVIGAIAGSDDPVKAAKAALKGNQGAIITFLLGQLLGLLKKDRKDEAVVAPTPAPDPVIVAPPAAVAGQKYYSLRAKVFFFEKAGRSGLYSKAEYDAALAGVDGAQMLNDFAHLDVSPFDANGQEIRTGDPRHPAEDENGYPRLRYRWWINGQQQHDTGNDHFHLSSVKDDKGCTPVLKLVEPWGTGKGKAEFEAYLPAEHNGGVEVTSNRISWYVD